MRIVQITDLHIGLAGEDTFEVDVRANFLQACQKISALEPEYLIVSGDLCYQDANPLIYSWIKQHLDRLDITYDLLSGNHDDPVLLAQSFEREHLLKNNALYYHRQIAGQAYFFLDSTTGIIGEDQIEWLSKQLSLQSGSIIIFMHHPPLLAGVPHMDQHYALQNRDEVFDLLLGYSDRIDVFCGHYHVDKSLSCSNVNVHITPSCFFQIDQFSASFAVDHRRPGFRVIVRESENLSHTVIYL